MRDYVRYYHQDRVHDSRKRHPGPTGVWSKYPNALRDQGFLPGTLRTNTTTCARLLAYVTGLVNQELLLQNEYLAVENRILKARLQPGWRLSDGERATLAEI